LAVNKNKLIFLEPPENIKGSFTLPAMSISVTPIYDDIDSDTYEGHEEDTDFDDAHDAAYAAARGIYCDNIAAHVAGNAARNEAYEAEFTPAYIAHFDAAVLYGSTDSEARDYAIEAARGQANAVGTAAYIAAYIAADAPARAASGGGARGGVA
jgi:hypothetical protein